MKQLLDQHFKIKDLGQLRFFLGFEIARSEAGIFLNRRKYTPWTIRIYGLLAAKPSSVPFNPTTKLSINEETLLEDPPSSIRLIGILIYLTSSKPDISFVIQHPSQYVSQPCMPHYQSSLHVRMYLKSILVKGIMFSDSSTLQLFAFANSDWDRCSDTRKPIIGYCVMLSSSLLCSKFKN